MVSKHALRSGFQVDLRVRHIRSQEQAEEPVRQVAALVERARVRATERGQNEAQGVELVHDRQAVDAPWLCGHPLGRDGQDRAARVLAGHDRQPVVLRGPPVRAGGTRGGWPAGRGLLCTPARS
jgi:hypothetical protein